MDLRAGRPLSSHEIAGLLQEARSRTLLLVANLSGEDLKRQHDPLMSPIVWDLGHIAHFEEVWLLEQLDGAGGSEGLRGMYNPFENPRSTRDGLPLPDAREARAFLGRIRRDVLESLDGVAASTDAPGPLLEDSFVYRLVLQHEYQHGETILQTLQLKQGEPWAAPRAVEPPVRPDDAPEPGTMVRIPGGRYRVGTDDRSEAYDNERPAHEVPLDPYWIDAAPVSNGEFLAFMEDGGYTRPELWNEEGFAWIREQWIDAPRGWAPGRNGWTERFFDRIRPVDPHRPVCHVCYWEADAWARWAGKRLPTEFEWEVAATVDPATGYRSAFPWGDDPATPDLANVDMLTFDTAPAWSYARNVSPAGCYGMIGDIWEWTSSDFRGYPGFRAFPYPEYSEVFFGDEYKVLRGGSFASRTGAIRSTFRNWDYPIRRQIFAGFRCVRDVTHGEEGA